MLLDAQAFKDNELLAWDLCAQNYDRCLTEHFRPFSQKLLSLAPLERGKRVLDIATGSGLAALIAARSVAPEGEVVGVDLSGRMVELAGQRAAQERIENVRFLQMDAENLRFPDQSFDVVLCALGLMLFPQPGLALSEMCRVLKAGGAAAVSVFGRGSKVALRSFIEAFLPHMPPADQRGPSTFGFGKGDTLREALHQAGFSRVHTEEQAHTLTLHTAEGVWEMMLSLGRLAQIHSGLGEDQQAQLRQDVLQIAAERYQTPQGVLELPFQITYAVASR